MEKIFLRTSKEGLVIANRGLIEARLTEDGRQACLKSDAGEVHAERGMLFPS